MSGTNAGSSHELGSNVITAVNCNPPQMPTLLSRSPQFVSTKLKLVVVGSV